MNKKKKKRGGYGSGENGKRTFCVSVQAVVRETREGAKKSPGWRRERDCFALFLPAAKPTGHRTQLR